MSFDVHVTEMSKKVSGTPMYINRIQDLLSEEARLIAVETLALSHINYGITTPEPRYTMLRYPIFRVYDVMLFRNMLR